MEHCLEKATFGPPIFLCIYNNYLSVIGAISAIYYTYFTYYTYIILHKFYLICSTLISCLNGVLHGCGRESLLEEIVTMATEYRLELWLLLEPGDKVKSRLLGTLLHRAVTPLLRCGTRRILLVGLGS